MPGLRLDEALCTFIGAVLSSSRYQEIFFTQYSRMERIAQLGGPTQMCFPFGISCLLCIFRRTFSIGLGGAAGGEALVEVVDNVIDVLDSD